jgi:hypothetical protein
LAESRFVAAVFNFFASAVLDLELPCDRIGRFCFALLLSLTVRLIVAPFFRLATRKEATLAARPIQPLKSQAPSASNKLI